MGTLLVTRSKEFLFTLDFVKDVDLMTLEMSHEGRRGKKLQMYLWFLQLTPVTVLGHGEQRYRCRGP